MKPIMNSKVPGHMGKCKPVWINPNRMCHRADGGVTGYFKNVIPKKFLGIQYNKMIGEEFHGIIWDDGNIYSTEGVYSTFRGPGELKCQ